MKINLTSTRRNIVPWIRFVLILTFLGAASAYGELKVARTLKKGQSISIYSYRCTLALKSSTSSLVNINCSKQIKSRFQRRPEGRAYLGPKQSARIKSRACILLVESNTVGKIVTRCIVPPTPTATPTEPPPAEPTPTPTPTATATSTQTPVPLVLLGGTISGLSGTVVLQNNSGDNLSRSSNGAFTFATQIAEGSAYNVTVFAHPAAQTCTVSNGSGIAGAAAITNVSVTCVDDQTTLSTSVTDLALSVSGITEFGVSGTPNSGVARLITITNTGAVPAQNPTVTFPTFPSGTTSSNSCGATLSPSSNCTITITPGNSATSNGSAACTNGTAPVAGVVSVSADNSNTVTTNVVVLGYGCIYQGGHVYAFDDTTPTSGSVGGKVLTVTDRAAPFPSGVVWSSNGGSGSTVSYDLIPGISETSSPTYNQAQTGFNSNYTNTGSFPFPPSGSFSSCNGRAAGACNSGNILTLYNTYVTNYGVGGSPYSLSSGPTTLGFYAAGLCAQAISGLSDWYLPAVCEMGPESNGSGCTANQNVVDSLPMLVGDPNVGTPSTSCTAGVNCLAGFYWTSTEVASNPLSLVWYQYFDTGGGPIQSGALKNSAMGVRCSRALTY